MDKTGGERRYVIDMKLFKFTGFYHMVNPNGRKLFNRNVYNVVHVTLVVVTSAITALGTPGVLFRTDRSIENSFKDMPSLFFVACITVGNLKIIAIVRHADELWSLFDVADVSFLSSSQCRAQDRKLVDCGSRYRKIFPWYSFLFLMTGFSWITMPIIVNRHYAAAEHVPKFNVVNLRYPVSAETYNAFYGALYVMESVMCGYGAIGLVVFDLFLIAILQVVSIQYEIISSAFEKLRFGADDGTNGDKLEDLGNDTEDDFRSIILDSQKLYKKLEIIYRISRPITLIYMVGDAVGMITMPYSIVLCYFKHGSSIFNTDVLTFVWTLSVAYIQSYIYCSLFQGITEKKEAVSFGLYCCDWTRLNVRTKKLVLLAMQVNSSNNLKMKATPAKFVDLPMLSVIARTSYNITSVLINKNIDKIRQSQW